MELFTVHLGRFIEPRGLTPPVVLPSYLPPERRQDLLDLLVSGLGDPSMVRIHWREDAPQLDGNRLRVRGLTLDTEGALLVAAVMSEGEMRQAIAWLPKVPALLAVYDACARCSVEHHKWLYDLKGMLVEALEGRVRHLLGGALADLDLAFPMHAFGDPLDVLAFMNARAAVHTEGFHEPEASQEAFARVIAEKMRSLSQDDLSLLLRLVTGETSQIVSLDKLGEIDDEALARLEEAGLVLLLGQKVTLRAPTLRLREPELLERTVLRLGPERLADEGEELYGAYLARLRPPRLEAALVALAETAGIVLRPGPVTIDEVEARLREAGERLSVSVPPGKGEAAEVEVTLLAGDGRQRALGLALRAYRGLQDGRLAEALEDTALARRADPTLGGFALAVQAYAGDQALFQWRLEDAIEHFQTYLARGGDPVLGYWKLGQAYHQLGQWDRALDFYQRALSEALAAGDRWQEGAALNSLGMVYADKGEWDRAIEFYQNALQTMERVGDSHGMAQTYNNLGIVYRRKGEWDRAIEFYQNALQTMERVGDVHGMAQTYNNLGLVYADKGEWDRAIEFYQKDLEISERVGDSHGMAQTYGNLGIVYRRKGEWDRAIEFYENALQTMERLGDIHGMAQTYNNLGLVYADKGEWDRAIEFYQKSLEISERVGDSHGMAQTWGNLGLLRQQQGEDELAARYFARSYLILSHLGAYEAQRVGGWLVELLGSPEAAEAYLRDFLARHSDDPRAWPPVEASREG
jgi:tetratricopeptide (TPR) repeat protein